MTGLIRLLQNSVGKSHDNVKTSTRTLVVPCQSCGRHVHIRVVDVLSRLDKPMDMKCKHCGRVVCFTSGAQSSVGSPAPEPSGSYHSELVIYDEPLPASQHAVQSQVSEGSDNSRRDIAVVGDIRQPVSNVLPVNSTPPSSHTSSSKRDIPARKSSVSFNNKPPVLYGNRDSTSNDSLNEFSEDQDSVFSRTCSTRSMISLQQKPSFSHSNLMLGLEIGAPQNQWNTASWHYSDSPAPSISRFLSSSPVPSLPDERISKRDDLAISIDGQTLEFSVSRRGSGDSRTSSIDLTSGRLESRVVGERNGDSDLTAFSISDSDMRGGISEKRRGKMPMRSNAFHRAAVSRRHSLKIEQQEQYEAETLSAKRRNSMSMDFEVEPLDEEVRHAHKIYTHQGQHLESDIQWARAILRRRRNWEHMRYEHPLKTSMELRLGSRISVESASSGRPPGMVHQPLPPLTISTTVPNISPRISGFSLQALPTPVKEEPEGDVLALGLAETLLGQAAEESSAGAFKSCALASSIESEGLTSPGAAISASRNSLSRLDGAARAFVTNVAPPSIAQPKARSVKARWKKAFESIVKKMSCFHVSDRPLLPSQTQQQPVISNARRAPGFEPSSFYPQFRSSGEIQDVPTSEEPLAIVANEVATLVAAMESPLFQVRFQARAEDLFSDVT